MENLATLEIKSQLDRKAALRTHAEQSIGKQLLSLGIINAEDVEQVLRYQRDHGLKFGEAAKQLGLISEEDIRQVLARQFDYPYLNSANGQFSEKLVAAFQPFSPQVEALRALRSQLILRWFELGHKTLSILSVNPEEGCSYLAANLAIVFSQLGESTLLIDANLRTPEQAMLFNIADKQGLSDVLAGRADDNVVNHIPEFVDLSVLAAGTIPPNPQELLSRDSFSSLIAKTANQYDIVLVDSPSSKQGSDALTVASRSQGVLLVIRKHHTRITDLQALTKQLRAIGVEIVGCFINEF